MKINPILAPLVIASMAAFTAIPSFADDSQFTGASNDDFNNQVWQTEKDLDDTTRELQEHPGDADILKRSRSLREALEKIYKRHLDDLQRRVKQITCTTNSPCGTQ